MLRVYILAGVPSGTVYDQLILGHDCGIDGDEKRRPYIEFNVDWFVYLMLTLKVTLIGRLTLVVIELRKLGDWPQLSE
jgi:hypothetical protein